jgi:hypothetical protein
MNFDPDDDIPPEELDMAVEEALGHPPPGTPAERIEALKRRIAYLQEQLAAFQEQTDPDAELAAGKVAHDLINARRQLAEWEHQQGARN